MHFKTLFNIVFSFFVLNAFAQNPLSISVVPIGQIESSVTEIPGQVLITVTNTSATDLEVYFTVGIVGNTADGRIVNIDNGSSASGNIVQVPSTGLAFSLQELIEQYQNTTLADYNISPSDFINQIRTTGHLPAGSYNICIEAFDLNGTLVSQATGLGDGNNCHQFDIVYYNPPVIQTPLNNTWVGENDDNQIMITWAHDYINPLTAYMVEIIRFPSQDEANNFMEQGNPQLLFETYGPMILTQEVIGSWNFNTMSADVLPNLTPGDVLAVRITAVSENVLFTNNGRSDIHVFIFGVPNSELCNNPSLNADWAFPSIGDTLPFTDIFAVARFQPSCDNILEMNAAINFARSLHGAVTGTTTVRNYEDNWRSGPGPANYLRNYFNRHFPGNTDYYPTGSDYEEYLPFLNNTSSTFNAERGEQVNIFGVLNFTIKELPSNIERIQTLNLNAMNSRGVVIGMPRPQLQSPANDAVMSPGNIQFDFSTGLEPGNPLPPFKIFKLNGNDYPRVPGLQVNEKCVFQVATTNTFQQNSIVFCRIKKIQSNPYHNGDRFNEDNPAFEPFSNTFDNTPQRLFDQDHFLNDVYKDLSISNDFSNEETLYWRVVWLKHPEAYNNCGSGIDITPQDIYHESSTRRLIISEEGIAGAFPDETQHCTKITGEEDEEGGGGSTASSDSSNCASPCVFPNITDTNASGSLAVGNAFTIAGFDAEVKTTSGAGNGTAVITIPFINNIKLRVNYSGLQLNAARQMINGTIEPIIDQTFPMSEFAGPAGRLFGMDETAADVMEAALEGGSKLLSMLVSGSEVSLPLGIDRDVAGQRIVIGIPSMTFRKDTAFMNVVVNINLPNLEVVEGFISLGAQVCITKNGFANDVKLYLAQDQVFPLGNTNEFRIKGAERSSDPLMMTSVEWDCNGFKALNLVGAIRFTREWLLPENERGIIQPTGQVEARFAGRIANGGNVLLRLDMDNFQIPGADGWGFTPARNAWIDLSDIENPLGFMAALPPSYVHASLTSAGMQNTWKGFFMEELSVRTPERLQGPDRNRLTFALRNMFIDNTGITFRASAENILRWDGDGNMAGWAASLDTIFLDISQNNFVAFGFNGKLGLPIAEETEYMIYQAALQHRRDSFNLLLSVRLADDIRIPISMANATIRSDSYVEVSLGTNTYIEAGLNATLSIGNNNLPSGQTMASSVSMPGIVVENLVINSETGFDTTNFSYSLTGMGGLGGGGRGAPGGGDAYYDEEGNLYFPAESNEGSMSGFPIGLDHFSISNDKITFQPRLTLSGSEGGFSAAAKISLLINMDLLSSPQRFDVTGVNLERIDLDISASDVTMRGYLEFYKTPSDEGVRGGLEVGINMGMRVAININADFGTRKQAGALAFNSPQWFSYFYVDGTVVFPGITLFSGVSLYGLGGGFYHHMRMANSLPSGGNVLTGAGRPSGVRYEPHFDTDLGLKFKVILGSNDNGEAYNLDVGIEAQFSFRHGLTRLAIEGSFRVMTDGISVETIGREGNSPVAGYVGMELNMPPGGPTIFRGQFFVKLKVPAERPMLRGIGTLPNPPEGWTSENAMVWAKFIASDNKNYFHMGTPTNRGGISLNFGGGADLLTITSYLMIGDSIPLVMPEPDAMFTRIFNRGIEQPDRAAVSLDGDVNELLHGNPREGDAPPTGSGFAMGLTIAMQTGDIEFFPFFFNLSAIMGCDINVTQASPEADRRCAGTDRVPGTDGWYATGQFYAGIEGAFGIKINLFIDVIKVNILEASAAIILRGGLPNPEWVSGRGSFYYNVCNGLAEGNCNFTFEAGTVCMPVTGNPFGGVALIQDLEPEDGATDVNIYADVSAAFSMDMNKTYEFQEEISAIDPPVIRRIQPYMHSFELKKQGSSTILTGEGEWTENNHIYTLQPFRRLDPESVHTLKVVARIRENGRDLLVRGVPFKEERLHTFTTGSEPDKVVDDNLSFTYPYINQQTFFKNETRDNQGYVRCKTYDNRCFQLGDVSDVTREFSVRFTDEDGNVINAPARILPQSYGVTFPVNQLLPDKLYCVQIIRKDTPINPPLALGNALHQSAFTIRHLLNTNINQSLQITNLVATVGNNVINSNQYKRISLPSGKVGQYEKEIYSYFFKTSKYNSLIDKIRLEGPEWESEILTFGVEFSRVKKSMRENFEWVDMQKFKVVTQSNKEFDKRIKFLMQGPPDNLDGVVYSTAIPPNQYLREVVSAKIFAPFSAALGYRANAVRSINQVFPGLGNNIPMLSPFPNYQKYNTSVYFNEQSRYLSPLSQDAINEAFTEIVGTNSALSNAISSRMSNLEFSFNPLMLTLPTGTFNTSTIISYEPTIAALNQYTEVRRAMVNFYNAKVRFSILGPELNVSDYLSNEEKAYLNRHISRTNLLDRCRWVNWTKGPQTFGMQYIFPDQNGNDVNGSLSPFTFRLR